MPSSNKISSQQQTTRNEAFPLYHQNIGGLRRKINELITSFYVNTPCIWCFLTLSKTHKK